ncbi:MAG: carboxypeptidase regulatory-like domain-containing protein [bacterium]|nr:carboxypeptidase regulatory-like domain-containing protein [bacterium]
MPTGIALAAESSVPGDALYPVKQVTERIRSLVDDDVVAEHRIEELEKLVAADAPAEVIADQVNRATEQVDRLGSDHQLGSRLDQATAVVAADRPTDYTPPVRDDGPADIPADKPGTTATTPTITTATTPAITTGTTSPAGGDGTTTIVPRDRPTTTTTTKVDSTTTTTVGDLETHLVSGYVHAGPTCPVERFPPDPACEDRPVPGAVLVIARGDGTELRRLEANDEGRFEVGLPNGSYLLIPRPYDGLLGTASPQEFLVEGKPVELDVAYDTGIR